MGVENSCLSFDYSAGIFRFSAFSGLDERYGDLSLVEGVREPSPRQLASRELCCSSAFFARREQWRFTIKAHRTDRNTRCTAREAQSVGTIEGF